MSPQWRGQARARQFGSTVLVLNHSALVPVVQGEKDFFNLEKKSLPLKSSLSVALESRRLHTSPFGQGTVDRWLSTGARASCLSLRYQGQCCIHLGGQGVHGPGQEFLEANRETGTRIMPSRALAEKDFHSRAQVSR